MKVSGFGFMGGYATPSTVRRHVTLGVCGSCYHCVTLLVLKKSEKIFTNYMNVYK